MVEVPQINNYKSTSTLNNSKNQQEFVEYLNNQREFQSVLTQHKGSFSQDQLTQTLREIEFKLRFLQD